MKAVTGGVVRNGRDGSARFWFVDRDRVLSWHGPGDERGTIEVPVPGAPPVMCADPWSPFAVLADGDSWRCILRPGLEAPNWVRHLNLLTGKAVGNVFSRAEPEADEPRLIAGWIEHRQGVRLIAGITKDRKVVVLKEDTAAVSLGAPVPGAAAILAVQVEGQQNATALLADGRVLFLTPHGWSELGRLGPASGTESKSGLVRLIALTGFRVDVGHNVEPGDAFEVPAERARELLMRGWAKPEGDAA